MDSVLFTWWLAPLLALIAGRLLWNAWQAHVAAWVIIDVVSLSGVFSTSLLSHGWPPGAAGIGGIGAFYLIGFSTLVLLPLIGPMIAFVWALRASRWSRWWERAATAAITLWTAAAGMLSLTLSA